ncbi:hypothetical protein GCM10010399_79030 [Dactylosporangium fulvum]|uniref:Uncharacterized protein n=1 Tax=Dactylosporangium fulvum TaxID=53359 RepID=A0ABY5VZY0_9ACTN|nr:hypothetical protein [Dactylosporangium fulvum]UWP83230.1 hypothetical protein Dfulv_02670 [Dactylosporangium fulvum]
MSRNRILIGQSEWAIDAQHLTSVVESVKSAMESATTAQLTLLDKENRPVTVYLNGRVAETVVVDLDLDRDSRPSEIS